MMNCEISPLSSMISWRVCPAFYPQGNIAGFPPVDKCDDGGSLQVLPICPNNPRNTYPRNCGPPTCKWFLLSVFSVFNPTKIARIFLCYLFIPVNLHLQSTGIGLIFSDPSNYRYVGFSGQKPAPLLLRRNGTAPFSWLGFTIISNESHQNWLVEP